MADSVILTIKSWLVSSEVGRRYLLEIGPQFQLDTSYNFQEIFLGTGQIVTLNCGSSFTFIWADQVIQYSIDNGTVMSGQLVMLTNNATGPVIKLIGILEATKVTAVLVS